MQQMTLTLTDEQVAAVAWQARSNEGGVPISDWVQSLVAGALAQVVAQYSLANAPVDPMTLQAGYLAAPADVQAQVAELLQPHAPQPPLTALPPVLVPPFDPTPGGETAPAAPDAA